MDYFFTDSDWSTGANFNAIKSETRENGKWEKLTVDSASPSKASAWVNWAPGDWTLRVQSTQTFDVSDADGKKIDGYNTVDFWVATPCRWAKSASAWRTCWTKTTPPPGASAHRGCIAQPTAHRVFILIKAVDVRLV